MDELDLELEKARAEYDLALAEAEAAKRAPIATTTTSTYGPGQLAYDVGMGSAKAFSGLADLLSYPALYGIGKVTGQEMPQWNLSTLLREEAAAAAPAMGLRPETEMQTAVEFALPMSKANKLAQTATGLLGYMGSKFGEAATESPYGEVAGSILLPALAGKAYRAAPATAKTIANLPARAAERIGELAGTEEGLRRSAEREILARLGVQGQEAISTPRVPESAVPYTAAELAGTPAMASYQQAIGMTEGGGDVLGPVLTQRKEALQSSLTDLGQINNQGALGIEVTGAARERLGQLATAKEAERSQLVESLKGVGFEPQQGEFSLALQDAQKAASKQKALEEGKLLEGLGLTEDVKATTKAERGTQFRSVLEARYEKAEEDVRNLWKKVPKTTRLEGSKAFRLINRDINKIGEITEKGFSSQGKEVLEAVRARIAAKSKKLTVGEMQDIQSAAKEIVRTTQNRKELGLFNKISDRFDDVVIDNVKNMTPEEQIMALAGGGKLPRNADPFALKKLKEGLRATRRLRNTFNEQIVGKVLEKRRGYDVMETSAILDKVLASPEKASQVLLRFGDDAPEVINMRQQMLINLDNSKNPEKFLADKIDVFKRLFKDDLPTIKNYVESRAKGAPLEQFANISDANIPSRVFTDERKAKQFVASFKGTDVYDFAKSKFTNTVVLKGENPLANLMANEKIAKEIYGSDFDKVQMIASDLQKLGLKKPGATQQATEEMFKKLQAATDKTISRTVFENAKNAAIFRREFKGTDAFELAKGYFIQDKILKGNAVENLTKNQQVAKVLFGSEYGDLMAKAKRYDKFNEPSKMLKGIAQKGSPTASRMTALGEILGQRQIIRAMKLGWVPGMLSNAPVLGTVVGAGVSKAGFARERKLDRMIAELLANPSMLKIAAKPATRQNVKALESLMMTLSGTLEGRGSLLARSIAEANTKEENRR